MSKRQWIMLFGVLVIVLPFLGLPSFYDKALSLIVGLCIISVAYRTRSSSNSKPPASSASASVDVSSAMPYVEHRSEPPSVPGNISNTNTSPGS